MSASEAQTIAPKSEIAELFFRHNGRPVHKWVHYLELYDRHFRRFKNTPVKMLEIGVFKGGSLELWRKYLGPKATIYGIDIDPACAERVDAPNQVRIGSQADPAFLQSVVSEMGGVDLVLDDGSHKGPHIIQSFRTLFPLLSDGGLYVIEDLHTDFGEWPGTRYNESLSFVGRLIGDMHSAYTGHEPREVRAIGGIYVADSIVFIEKNAGFRTGSVLVG